MRAKTPSFIAEFPLATTPADERVLAVRLEAARQVYNACLGESLRRLDLMRQSKDWQRARAMSKTLGKDSEGKPIPNKARTALFKATIARFGFTYGSIQKIAESCREACWISDHLGSHDTQATSLRAFRAVQQYAFGKRGRPRFKGHRGLHSIEGKSNAAVIRYRDGAVHWDGLVLPIRRDPKDKHKWQERALASRTKYCRIVRRTQKGRDCWHVQLVQEGRPPVKERRPVRAGIVGLDLGPSTIAAVSDADAMLEVFCPTVVQPWKAVRRIERAMDRSRRATNPHAFDEKGRWLPGRHKLVKSSRYLALQRQRAEVERCLAAERKRAHGELCNRILAQGNIIKTEKLSYKGFQRAFGKSVKVRAPGMLVERLRRKADNAGGAVIEIDTRKTRLSQFDHTTGEYVKKPLSQRHHVFGDGITAPVQRDLYSAFLARHCSEDTLDACQVIEAWPAAEPLLRRAASSVSPSASGERFPLPYPSKRRVRADRPSKRDGRPVEAEDGVAAAQAARESLGETGHGALRTPWL